MSGNFSFFLFFFLLFFFFPFTFPLCVLGLRARLRLSLRPVLLRELTPASRLLRPTCLCPPLPPGTRRLPAPSWGDAGHGAGRRWRAAHPGSSASSRLAGLELPYSGADGTDPVPSTAAPSHGRACPWHWCCAGHPPAPAGRDQPVRRCRTGEAEHQFPRTQLRHGPAPGEGAGGVPCRVPCRVPCPASAALACLGLHRARCHQASQHPVPVLAIPAPLVLRSGRRHPAWGAPARSPSRRGWRSAACSCRPRRWSSSHLSADGAGGVSAAGSQGSC